MNASRPRRLAARIALLFSLCAPTLALAQIKIGLVLSLTGPAASLGIPARDTAAMFPAEIAGQ